MKYCIPGDITPIDVNGDGLIERLYAGDVGGEIWRFDIGDMSNTARLDRGDHLQRQRKDILSS